MNLTKIKSALKAGNYEPIQELINANANVLPHGLYRIKNDDIQFMHREDVFDLEDLLDVLELPIDQVYWLTQNKFWILLSGETTSGFYVFHSEVAPLVNLTIRNGGDFAAKGEFDIPNTLPLQDILVEDLTDEQREEMISHLVDDGYEIDEDTSDEEILEYYAEMCEGNEDDEDDEDEPYLDLTDPKTRENTIDLLIDNGYATTRDLTDQQIEDLYTEFDLDRVDEDPYEAPDLTDPEVRADIVELLIANGYTDSRNLSDSKIKALHFEMFEDGDLDDDDDDLDAQDEASVLAFDLGDGTFIVGAID